MKYIVVIMMALMVIGTVSAGTLTSGVVLDATGTVATSGNTVSDGNGSIAAYGTSTFGVASLKYASTATDGGTMRSMTMGAGRLTASDSMSSIDWLNPTQSCNGKTCEVVPGYFIMTAAESTVMLTGPGTVSTVSGPSAFSMSATGTGTLNYHVGVLDIQGITDPSAETGVVKPTSEFAYSERVQAMGKFDVTTTFKYKP
jgi:hypothetical protein